MRRDLGRLEATEFDLLVIGAGIHGACIARDAAQRGLEVALIDQGDLGGATSHNSLKIVHGGLRYWQSLDVPRIRETAMEQRRWLHIAPDLVRPLPCLMPTYGHGTSGPEALAAALLLHAATTRWAIGRLPGTDPLPVGRIISKGACLERLPGIAERGLSGGAVWYDAQILDADRLLLACVVDAAEQGAVVANYVRAEGFLGEEGCVEGVEARDVPSGAAFAIRARLTVNAVGPWLADLLRRRVRRVDPGRFGALARSMNLVTRPLLGDHAAGLRSRRRADGLVPRAGRLYLVTPWQGRSILGTSHARHDGPDVPGCVDEAEIEAFLGEINEAYPPANLTRRDVFYVYAGLTPAKADGSEGEVRRSHRSQVVDHAAEDGVRGLLSAQGIKWTTARAVAERAVDIAFARLGREPTPCRSGLAPLPRGEHFRALEPACTTDPAAAEAAWRRRVAHAVAEEMALRLEDLLLRRIEHAHLGLLSDERMAFAADAMAAALGWSAERRARELAELRQLLARHRGVRADAPGGARPQPGPSSRDRSPAGMPIP